MALTARTLADHARVEAQNHTTSSTEPNSSPQTHLVHSRVTSERSRLELDQSYNENLTMKEAEELDLSTLKQVTEEKISTENVQLARVVQDKGLYITTAEEVGIGLARLIDCKMRVRVVTIRVRITSP